MPDTPSFKDLPEDVKPFLAVSQDTINLLELITPAEKAQAVPHIKIWRINPSTGAPLHGNAGGPTAPLTMRSAYPPAFGLPGDVTRRERPDVSLERLNVNTKFGSQGGMMLFRQIELKFTVHRPEYLFYEEDDEHDKWSDLLWPGGLFCVEYGWRASSGVTNGLLSGDGYVDGGKTPPTIVPGARRLRFIVTHYDFTVMQDAQVSIVIHGLQDGDFNTRERFMAEEKNKKLQTAQGIVINAPDDPYSTASSVSSAGRKTTRMARLLDRFAQLKDKVVKNAKTHDDLVSIQTIFDTLFAQDVSDSLSLGGYANAAMYFGNFNDKVGKTSQKHGAKDLSGKSIGEFMVPLKDVTKLFSEQVNDPKKALGQLTLYNMMRPIINVIQRTASWNRLGSTDADGNQVTSDPVLGVRIISNVTNDPSKSASTMFIVDLKRELVRSFEKNESAQSFKYQVLGGQKPTKNGLSAALASIMPIVSFGKGNSYIQDAQFSVMVDEPMKTLFIAGSPNRSRDRSGRVTKTDLSHKQDTASSPLLVYSSAIQGEINMLGNFAFDAFGYIWVEMSVPIWSGPFWVRETEDTVDAGGFVTRIHVVSAGGDPLGIQRAAAAALAGRPPYFFGVQPTVTTDN